MASFQLQQNVCQLNKVEAHVGAHPPVGNSMASVRHFHTNPSEWLLSLEEPSRHILEVHVHLLCTELRSPTRLLYIWEKQVIGKRNKISHK